MRPMLLILVLLSFAVGAAAELLPPCTDPIICRTGETLTLIGDDILFLACLPGGLYRIDSSDPTVYWTVRTSDCEAGQLLLNGPAGIFEVPIPGRSVFIAPTVPLQAPVTVTIYPVLDSAEVPR